MLRNYLKIAMRSLWRNKVHSIINVLGLSLGIACCLLIVLFVYDELTFDRFHSKADRTYRVYARENWGVNQEFFYTSTPFPMGPTLKENLKEVEAQVRFSKIGTQVKIDANQFSETVTFAGEDFFDVFDFELTSGERNSALRSPGQIVLTETLARKYFGNADPLNKSIAIQLGDSFEEFIVKGVAKDVPINSSLNFALLISDLNYTKIYSQQTLTSAWFNINPETYILLKEGTSYKDVMTKFPSIFKTVLGEDEFTKSKYEAGLQPLTSIHLDTSFPVATAPVSDPKYSYILGAVALLILVVACINFVTLSVGRSLKRAKEVGIRKVVGAERKQLITQFIGEAIIVTLISLIIGLVAASLSLPTFNNFASKELSMPFDGFLFGVIGVLLLIIGLIAGSYPAFVLSSFKPIAILKGSLQTGNSKQTMRKVLVGIQLVLSIFLISSTLIMREQLQFLQNKNLGFDKEQLAVVQLNVPRGRLAARVAAGFEKAEQFKTALATHPGIAAVCASSHDFGNGGWVNAGYTDDLGTYRTFDFNSVDDDYIPTLGMEMSAGRNFSDENTSDKRRAIIVNEALVKEYGWNDAIGKRIPGKNFTDHEIIGVVRDFNYASLYNKVTPLILVEDPAILLAGTENINTDNSPVPKIIMRLKPGNMSATIDGVKEVWNKITGGEEFNFDFVDQALANQYRADQNLGKIISIATALAILIGSLGLYALASLAIENRTKEISIRKVMGATEESLLLLLSKDYVYLIVICLILSVPFTYYVMSQWLQSFEYRVGIGAPAFLIAGGVSLFIAILTIGHQAIKTAWTRPAETLRCE